MKFTFKGGIHPYEGKELTEDKDVKEYLPKGDMVYPLSQHIGAPAKPVVKKGDRVLVGQLIAEAGGFVSANIHSAVSGTVKVIENRLTASGSKVNSIVIENDGLFEEADFAANANDKPLDELTKELQQYVKKNTAPYKYPRKVVYIDEMPHTTSGKVIRNAVKAIVNKAQ